MEITVEDIFTGRIEEEREILQVLDLYYCSSAAIRGTLHCK